MSELSDVRRYLQLRWIHSSNVQDLWFLFCSRCRCRCRTGRRVRDGSISSNLLQPWTLFWSHGTNPWPIFFFCYCGWPWVYRKTPPDFANLSRLGHFLKGSSAALGLIKVRESCEKLQHYGNRKDASGISTITNDEAKTLIEELLVTMKVEYKEAKDFLTGFYAE